MKLLCISFLMLVFVSSSVFAGVQDVFTEVLNSPAVADANFTHINKVEIIRYARCRGCYDIEVSGLRPSSRDKVSVFFSIVDSPYESLKIKLLAKDPR